MRSAEAMATEGVTCTVTEGRIRGDHRATPINMEEPVKNRKRALIIATVDQSLVFQSPHSWSVLRSNGYELTFACRPGLWVTRLTQWGSVVPLPTDRSLGPLQLLNSAVALRRLLSQRWDLIQVQSPIAAALTRILWRRSRMGPLIYVVHGYHFDPDCPAARSTPARIAERLLLDRSYAVAAVSGADYAWAAERARRAVVKRLPGAGVDISRFTSQNTSRRAPYLLFCGELNENKDPLFAVEVVRRLRTRGYPYRLTMIGRGRLEPDVRRLAELETWIDWIPHTDEVERYMRDAFCLISPSWREGLPRVIIESLASGTPVVARANRGSRELLEGLPGIVGRDSSVDDFADTVEQTLARPPSGEVLHRRAMEYDLMNFGRAYSELIDQVVPKPHVGAGDNGNA